MTIDRQDLLKAIRIVMAVVTVSILIMLVLMLATKGYILAQILLVIIIFTVMVAFVYSLIRIK